MILICRKLLYMKRVEFNLSSILKICYANFYSDMIVDYLRMEIANNDYGGLL